MTKRSTDSATPAAERRVFFAALPGAVERQRLTAALAGYGTDPHTAQRLRWLEPAGWHVTLRFVGNITADLVPPLLQSITPIEPFGISFTRLEPFPSARRPRVLAATGSAEESAQALVETLERHCRALALDPVERTWRPHMSLARVRGRGSVQLPLWPLQLRMWFSRFVLMESVQGPNGNRYVPIDRHRRS